ncbi:MAG: DUF3575 domain-containing protein [Bacteroidaceae bacterium]|nr:DUF3575 domain-containing protein [Bacteroidaceae bacterium]
MLLSFKVNAQMMVVKSDIMRDVALAPNLHVDFTVGEKHTLGLGGSYGNSVLGKDINIATFDPNFRYWFNGRPFTRQYIGIDAQLAQYDVHWGRKIFDGSSFAVGLIFGHVANLSKRWNLELEGGIDILSYSHKEYYKGDVYEDYGEKNNGHGTIMCPHLSVSFSYIIR